MREAAVPVLSPSAVAIRPALIPPSRATKPLDCEYMINMRKDSNIDIHRLRIKGPYTKSLPFFHNDYCVQDPPNPQPAFVLTGRRPRS